MTTPFTALQEIGEFGLINRMLTRLGLSSDDALHQGIGDDAAVYHVGDGVVHVVTTDALIEGVHFDLSFMPMRHLGVKAIAVNVSDVVAMNAQPRYATIALGVPPGVSVEMVEALYDGLAEACRIYDLTLVGGDTTMARQLTLAVTVIGAAAEDAVVYRRGARPGDLLCVTGDLGAAYAGLKVLLDQRRAMAEAGDDFQPNLDPFRYLIQRQLTPTARLQTLRQWAAVGVRPRALIDVSDGLASEVHHLCEQSDCGALIHSAALPIDTETRHAADQFMEDVDTYALYGGEDYELLFALPEADFHRLPEGTCTVVGTFTEAADGIRIVMPEGGAFPLEAAGYQHFGPSGDEAPPNLTG